MVWLPDDEKISKITICFDRMHERDGHTDRQTPHNGIGRAYASHRTAKIPSRNKLFIGVCHNSVHIYNKLTANTVTVSICCHFIYTSKLGMGVVNRLTENF